MSPLLSNIMLTDLDRWLERRGHAFVRYADDCNVYLGSRRAAEKAFAAIRAYLEQTLKLPINETKSAVARASTRTFLSYGLVGKRGTARLKIAPAAVNRFRRAVKHRMRQNRGTSLARLIQALNPLLRGWMSYFRYAQVKLVMQQLDGWIRRRLRCRLWRQAKRNRTRGKLLMKHGIATQRAWRSATNGRGAWWNAGASHMHDAFRKLYFDRMGLVSLVDTHRRFQFHS